MPLRSASFDSSPGSVSARTRWPACCNAGAMSSHEDASSQKPGMRMMSTAVMLRGGPRARVRERRTVQGDGPRQPLQLDRADVREPDGSVVDGSLDAVAHQDLARPGVRGDPG